MPEHALDANVFIHAVDLSLRFDDPVTVPLVVDELESEDAAARYDLGQVAVYEPAEEAVERVEAVADAKGEDLSDADIQLLALAMDRDAVLVTDDYGMQNVAESVDMPYEGFDKDEIQEGITWKRVCEDCGAAVDGERCRRCGGEPKRIPDG